MFAGPAQAEQNPASLPTDMPSADPHGSHPVRDQGPHLGPGQIAAPARDEQPP